MWYTQESLTDYLNGAAAAYNEDHKVRVEPMLVSSTEYMEQINDASLHSEEGPDLFITTNDALEKAYLAGLACEVPDRRGVLSTSFFPRAALSAISTEGKKVAYPLYYETSGLLVNTTYLEEYATSQVLAETATEGEEDESRTQAAEDASGNEAEAEPELTEEQKALIEERVASFKPATFAQLEAFANGYDAPELVESIFKWDVTNIFYNYAFPGAYLNVGGESGDDVEQLDFYNLNAIRALNEFQKLNQFFFFETKNCAYDTVISEFLEGKVVFTIAGIDAVSTLEKAREEGTFTYDYEILPLPDINEELLTRELSISTVVAINGYSEHVQEADDFAAFLTCDYTEPLYTYTGKLAANLNTVYEQEAYETFRRIYDGSISIAKLLETGNYWIQLEIALEEIWSGADTNTTLKGVAETIAAQVSGEEVSLETIEVPVEETGEEVLEEGEMP